MILRPDGDYLYRRQSPTIEERFWQIDRFCEEFCSGSEAVFEDTQFRVTIERKEPK